ncbi:MAG: hypothetical protein A2Y98_00160 [Candidatus Portnoybacteria bacterium RBG_19FT_COMBO_36_7]|uniref:Uncharacterized protein n=1 Tax=Candidatus Portnoybacteria bacterium RBG_19FT_COMBO_36_7 TaxID=1801992 RepID=A0A1G2F9I1_9BACT|nr:MAG: hypothetical protein A2Y98_00160 [Candidatus Portnoybacteria bacterium RBG_19FT_COMBO_36_7]
MAGPLLEKPIGESKLGRSFGTNWNNWAWGSDGPVLCEICGTKHPKREDDSYIISKFLGMQVVEECCGAILDRVYRESGEEFTVAFLEEFANNPTSPRFSILLMTLNEVCIKAQKAALETAKQLHTVYIKLVPIVDIAKTRT